MESTISWLTEDNNLSVKYFTNRDIIGKRVVKKEYQSIVNNIANSVPASTILNLRNKDGWWSVNNYSYNPLYKNTFWQLYFLSLLGINREIDGIDKSVGLIAKNMQREDGSFPSYWRYSGNLPCMEGIALEMLLRLGYIGENFTKKTITFINNLVYSESFRCKYRQNLRCPWGTIKILKAYNLIIGKYIDERVEFTIKKALDFLVRYNIVEANYPRKKKRSNHWFTFGYPRSYQGDILELVSAAVDRGCRKNSRNIK